MITSLVSVDCDAITDWPSFHEAFAYTFGFRDFYGKNMNAWVDCLTYLDDPAAGMTNVHCAPGAVMVLELLNVKAFRQRCPEQYDAVIECSAFVNWRRLETGEPAVLAMSFYR